MEFRVHARAIRWHIKCVNEMNILRNENLSKTEGKKLTHNSTICTHLFSYSAHSYITRSLSRHIFFLQCNEWTLNTNQMTICI